MRPEEYYRILELEPGATEKQLKAAYRKLAMRYHPDRDPSAGAKRKFQEVKAAYEYLLQHRDISREEEMAGEIYRREREKMFRYAQARREQKIREENYFNRPEWHDPFLLLKYASRVAVILFAAAAIVLPLLLAIFDDPLSLAGTFFFLVAGIILSIYIYQQRADWFRLGKFMTTWKEVVEWIRMKQGKSTSEHCCYTRNDRADGQPYRIELLKTLDIKVSSFGVLNHGAKYRNKVKRVILPRSLRAQRLHRLSSLLKLVSIIFCLLFFPVESILWRFVAGLVTGGVASAMVLWISGVRSKVSYLFTPALLIKSAVWILVLCGTSRFGPGFNVVTTGYIKIAVVGLLFFLDMAFDLVMGFFPFYNRLFRPVAPQGTVLSSLYRDGYQNNLELPVYSVLFPLYKWLF